MGLLAGISRLSIRLTTSLPESRRRYWKSQPATAADPPRGVPPAVPELAHDNRLGGFTRDGREYVIRLDGDQETPLPWANVLANPGFGTIVTAGGAAFTWSLNSRENRLTPHAGEFEALFGRSDASKPERASGAARRAQSVVVFKGPDTVVAAPDGRVGFAPPAPAWLASAGTGDVLAGMIAALRARGMPAFETACAGVWLHGRAAELAGAGMIADDLVEAIPAVMA